MRSLLAVTVVVLAFGATLSAAGAKSSSCAALQSAYAALAKHGGMGRAGNVRADYNRVKARAWRAGCMGGFFFFDRRAQRQCPSIMARLNQLQSQFPRLRLRVRRGSRL